MARIRIAGDSSSVVFAVDEVSNVTISDGELHQADIHFPAHSSSLRQIVRRLVALLATCDTPETVSPRLTTGAPDLSCSQTADAPACLSPATLRQSAIAELSVNPALWSSPAEADGRHTLYFRQDARVSGWQIKSDVRGRLRVKNPLLFRKKELCQAIERDLMAAAGIERFSTNPLTGSVLVHYDPGVLSRSQVIEILDSALGSVERSDSLDRLDLHLPTCTASIPLAAAAQFLAPPLLPVAAALYAVTSIPTLREARRVYVEEQRIGVDALDAVVMVGCLGTLSIFPGAVCCWCLSFGRYLVKKSRDSSQKLLMGALGKQPRYVWLCRGDIEVQVPAEKLEKGDTIVVHTGEVVPVDGCVIAGMGLVDQHALTGEATPAEKGTGDPVFASTLLVSGEIKVTVELSGSETASARIGQILTDTAGFKMASQHKGERLADKAVLPTLGIGALGFVMMGPMGAVAVLNSDLGTGIRMAVPLAMLSSLALCASKGILVKDGRALEMMNQVDTVLFDKTGTLTREQPEVGRIITTEAWSCSEILGFAAAAERKFHHPVALALLHKAEELKLTLPPTDETQYKVGYGITVNIAGRTVRIGSKRFLEAEGIAISPVIAAAIHEAHGDGHTVVLVGVDNEVGGAIELRAAVRPEVRDVIRGLRARGIKHIAIISGDHDAPTRKLAESLGMDRYFAQVLPADKADYVARLQAEGGKVCFVGDGINDSIALKKADVSISLRGASSIATDTAQIVFLEGGLSKLCELRDIARDLDRNVNRSWSMIVAPNVTNVVGVFTMGFGVMTSVMTNNVSALFALGNGLLPLRKITRAESSRRVERATRSKDLARHSIISMPPSEDRHRAEADADRPPVLTESA